MRIDLISRLLVVLLCSSAAFAQDRSQLTSGPTLFVTADGATSRKGETRTEKLASKLMGRDLSYRIILPVGYSETSNAATRYPVVYLLHGLTGNYANWTDRTKLADHAAGLGMIIVTPEGENGWYTDGTNAADKYESYIVRELIPEVDTRFRTKSDRKHRVIAGLSMGGYGALKFGMKYPEMFSLAGSFSGALGAATFPDLGRSDAALKSLTTIFGPMDSEIRRSNDIFRLVKEITAERQKALPFLYIDCGTEDFLFSNNREFIDLLLEKRVPHEFRQRPGGHTWTYWDKQVQEFLRVANRHFE